MDGGQNDSSKSRSRVGARKNDTRTSLGLLAALVFLLISTPSTLNAIFDVTPECKVSAASVPRGTACGNRQSSPAARPVSADDQKHNAIRRGSVVRCSVKRVPIVTPADEAELPSIEERQP